MKKTYIVCEGIETCFKDNLTETRGGCSKIAVKVGLMIWLTARTSLAWLGQE